MTAINYSLYDNGNRVYSPINKPSLADLGAAAASHAHPWAQITGVPVQATRWPTFAEVTAVPATATRWPTFAEVSDKPATYAPSAHTHDDRYNVTHKFDAVVRQGAWSRIARTNVVSLGGTYLLALNHTRGNVVVNALFLVSASHFNSARISQLSSGSHTQIQVRLTSVDGNDIYIEVLDTAAGTGDHPYSIRLECVGEGNATPYASFTAGGGTVLASIQSAFTDFIGNGSGLTTLNASNLSSGVVPNACLPATATRWPTAAEVGALSSGGGALTGNLHSSTGGIYPAANNASQLGNHDCRWYEGWINKLETQTISSNGTIRSNAQVRGFGTGNVFSNAGLEAASTTTDPSISFHKEGAYAATLRLIGNAHFGFVNQTNSEYADLTLRNLSIQGSITSTLNVNAGISVNQTDGVDGKGLSLYGGATNTKPSYGMFFGVTSKWGTHGSVGGDWATYFTMEGATNRGWIFQHSGTNVASISSTGEMSAHSFRTSPNLGTCSFSTGNGDAANFDTNNIKVETWNGFGIWCTAGTPAYSHYFNARTGDFGAKGNITGQEVYAKGWFRTPGNTGLHFDAWGGGLHMQDPVWIRTYGGKKLHVANTEFDAIDTGGGVFAGSLNLRGSDPASRGQIKSTSGGDLHVGAGGGPHTAGNLYLNWYAGTGRVVFGNGREGQAAELTSGGDLHVNTSITTNNITADTLYIRNIAASGRITTSNGFSGNGDGISNIKFGNINTVEHVLFNNPTGLNGGNFVLSNGYTNYKALVFYMSDDGNGIMYSFTKTVAELNRLQSFNKPYGVISDANYHWIGRFEADGRTFTTRTENGRMFQVIGLL